MGRVAHRVDAIVAEHVVDASGSRGRHRIGIADGVIESVTPTGASADVEVIMPGLVDLQVNGYGAVDVNTAPTSHWGALETSLLAHGVTSWMPTLVSAPLDTYVARLEAIARHSTTTTGPEIIGVHLEGPFLGAPTGVHDPSCVRPIDAEFLATLPTIVRRVTLAPELPGAPQAITGLVARGVAVALGHTAASPVEVRAAVEVGASSVTHCWNAMAPLHHREPGPVLPALLDDRITVSIIADGVHVDPDVVALTWRCKPDDRFMVVSDAVAADGISSSTHSRDATDGSPRSRDGRLSGSTALLDTALRTLVDKCGMPIERAVAAATLVPLAASGVAGRGRIAPGQRADLAAMSAALHPVATLVAGEMRWCDGEHLDPLRWSTPRDPAAPDVLGR